MYKYDENPNTLFTNDSKIILNKLREMEYAVLVGRNNCGKSFILKSLALNWGQDASYLGPARYQNFSVLGAFSFNRNRKQEKFRNFQNQFKRKSQNIDNSPLNLQQAIAELPDRQRDKLLEIVGNLLNTEIEIKHTVEDNTMSQKYVSCDGHNLSFTSWTPALT